LPTFFDVFRWSAPYPYKKFLRKNSTFSVFCLLKMCGIFPGKCTFPYINILKRYRIYSGKHMEKALKRYWKFWKYTESFSVYFQYIFSIFSVYFQYIFSIFSVYFQYIFSIYFGIFSVYISVYFRYVFSIYIYIFLFFIFFSVYGMYIFQYLLHTFSQWIQYFSVHLHMEKCIVREDSILVAPVHFQLVFHVAIQKRKQSGHKSDYNHHQKLRPVSIFFCFF
jgi:hypothetical protein